ncbi:ESD [Symbiodinium sp. KB8]|nr:ESD [Symbiodinium sp. KB8]
MHFHVYIPPGASADKPVPFLLFLSGLTCTDENFITKAGAQRKAAEKGVALVCPDTSPRGANIEGEDESYDFGSGAGFYVDATEDKWSKHYNMYSYVTKELPSVLSGIKELSDKCSVFGHSMGGHGALICALKNPGKYASVSAFSPIANPSTCPWGEKAFGGYLGSDKSKWHAYDASHLVGEFKSESTLPIFVDQVWYHGTCHVGAAFGVTDHQLFFCCRGKPTIS